LLVCLIENGMHKPFFASCCLFSLLCHPLAAEVRLERVPENGVQPQVAVEAGGKVHLVYLTGRPEAADVHYSVRDAGKLDWGQPVLVNGDSHSAVAMGTIRGAQLALGGHSVVHFVWNGRAEKNAYATAPLYYTRLVDGKISAPLVVNAGTLNLDGGASVTADGKGGVAILWHAAPPEGHAEADRQVYVARSVDEGGHFSVAQPALGVPAGVCACCSLKALSSAESGMLLFYRTASSKSQRDMSLLSAGDGVHFSQQLTHAWPVGACPMSSAALVACKKSVLAAWETDGRIFYANPALKTPPIALSEGKTRHPAMAVNAAGETIVCWSIGTGWQRGGELAWRVMATDGTPTEQKGTAKDVPVWSHTAAFAQAADFVVLH
jgi:hypothetical protein